MINYININLRNEKKYIFLLNKLQCSSLIERDFIKQAISPINRECGWFWLVSALVRVEACWVCLVCVHCILCMCVCLVCVAWGCWGGGGGCWETSCVCVVWGA